MARPTAIHRVRGVETPSFRAGRKRRSLPLGELSAGVATFCACPATGFDLRLSRKPRCWGFARMRFGWNLGQEQRVMYRRGRGRTPGYRVTWDSAGRWPIAFAAIPEPVPGPGTGEVVGVDRGVAVSAALSTGTP